MSHKVTIQMLRRMGACKRDRDIFEQVFPDGVEVNVENVEKAVEARLSIGWFFQTAFPHRFPEFLETICAVHADAAQEDRYGMTAEQVKDWQRRWARMQRQAEGQLLLKYWEADPDGPILPSDKETL